MHKQQILELTLQMTPGLDKEIVIILADHIGYENRVSSDYLEKRTGVSGGQIRTAVRLLRRTGLMICSEYSGGYWVAAVMKEYAGFRDHVMLSHINDMITTLKAMDESAIKEFGGDPGVYQYDFDDLLSSTGEAKYG